MQIRVLPFSGISLLFVKIYTGVLYVKEICLYLNTGQSCIVPFRRTIVDSSRTCSQMLSRASRKLVPWNFLPGPGIEPGTLVLVVRCTYRYTNDLRCDTKYDNMCLSYSSKGDKHSFLKRFWWISQYIIYCMNYSVH